METIEKPAKSTHEEPQSESNDSNVLTVNNSHKDADINEALHEIENTLYIPADTDVERFTVPEYKYTPLNQEPREVRLLKLYPTNTAAEHIRCDFETYPLAELPSFSAIKNARGYRKLQEAIEVNGQVLLITIALERFLRYLRLHINKPTLLWVRYACVVESDPQEQAAYWTREFSDVMYAHASEVFDMHKINARLIEDGCLRIVVHSGGVNSKKEWYGAPEQPVLPRICPIRLGTKVSIEAPEVDYQYMPLDMVCDEIRVMCIMPAKDATAPIVMHAAHCPIRSEVNFIALSYRWGTDLAPEQVIVNGQRKSIRKSLADAIRVVRMTELVVPMWIDALCINQDDLVERGRQVPRMGEIYDNAMMVYSYVGEQTEDIAPALEFMKELEKHPMITFNDLNEFHFGEEHYEDGKFWYGENTIKPDRLAGLCVALYRFLTRQYFRRVWVLQEVAWASNPTIFAGHKLSTSFDSVDKAAYHLQDMLIRDVSLGGQMQTVDPSLPHIDVDMLAYPRKLFYFRYLLSSGGGHALPFYQIKHTSPEFLETLILTRDFECTDARDHIFALWSLAQDKKGLDSKPDYSKPYEQIYEEFTQAWIKQHGTLDILGAVEATVQSNDFYTKAPSWCTNWNLPATASCLVRKDYIPARPMSAIPDQGGNLYSASGDNLTPESFPSPLFTFRDHALHCRGLVIDQLKFSFPDAPDIPAGSAPKSTWRFHYWTDAIVRYYRSNALTTYADALRAAWAMFHGDNVAAWPPFAESGYPSHSNKSRERYVCLPSRARHVSRYADSYSRSKAWGVVKTVLRGRRPFVTENGYMGLAPTYVCDWVDDLGKGSGGDVIWHVAVVAGCSVPLLLQDMGDGSWRLVGSCFVQGWMDGEWIGDIMGVDNAMDFWEAMGDDAQLVIR